MERVEQKIGDMMEAAGEKQQRYLNYMNDFELFLTSINYFERVPNEVIKRILDYIFLKTKKIENIDFIIELLKNIKRKILPSVLNIDVLINNYISTLDKVKSFLHHKLLNYYKLLVKANRRRSPHGRLRNPPTHPHCPFLY